MTTQPMPPVQEHLSGKAGQHNIVRVLVTVIIVYWINANWPDIKAGLVDAYEHQVQASRKS